MVNDIDKAVQSGRKIKIIYVAKSGVITKRVIQIISSTDEKIVAYCYMRNQVRTFKRVNILAMELIEYKMEVFA